MGYKFKLFKVLLNYKSESFLVEFNFITYLPNGEMSDLNFKNSVIPNSNLSVYS